jgi:hypothetical protein
MPRDNKGKISGYIDQKRIAVNIGNGPGEIRKEAARQELEATNTLLGTIQFGAETVIIPQKFNHRYEDYGVRILYLTRVTMAKLTACHSSDYDAKKMTCSRSSYQGNCEIGRAVSTPLVKSTSECEGFCSKNRVSFKNKYLRARHSRCLKRCKMALSIASNEEGIRNTVAVPWPESGFLPRNKARHSDSKAAGDYDHDQHMFDKWKDAVLYAAKKPGFEFKGSGKKVWPCQAYDKQLFMASKS